MLPSVSAILCAEFMAQVLYCYVANDSMAIFTYGAVNSMSVMTMIQKQINKLEAISHTGIGKMLLFQCNCNKFQLFPVSIEFL